MSAVDVTPPSGPSGPSCDEEVTAFFIAHREGLRRYLISACRCPEHEAEDITQDSFLAVRGQWEHVRLLDKPKAYLYKVAVLRLFRLRQRQARRLDGGDPDDHLLAFPDPADAFESADRKAEALALLALLPPRQRQVLWLRRGAGFTGAETAHILGITESTVKTQLRDAEERIQELVRKTRSDEWRGEPR